MFDLHYTEHVYGVVYKMNNQDMFINIVARRGSGGSLVGIIQDGAGVDIPLDQYTLEQDGDNFSFNFKKPFRPRSGREDTHST